MADVIDFATAVGALIRDRALAPATVSLDTDGTPYWDPENGTHRVMLDTDGTPYYTPADQPLAVMGADGTPELTVTPTRVPTVAEVEQMVAGLDTPPTWDEIDTPETFPPAPHRHDAEDIDGLTATSRAPDLVAFIASVLSQAQVRPVPIMFLGSSSTHAGHWPEALWARLTHDYPAGGSEPGIERAATVAVPSAPASPGLIGYNAGIAGAGTQNYVTGQIVSNAATVQPFILFHEIGSNNWAGSQPIADVMADMEAALGQLDAVITVPHVHIIVHSQWRLDQNSAAKMTLWDEYGVGMRQLADADPDRRLFISTAQMFRTIDIGGTDPLGFRSTDGAHMSTAGDLAKGEVMYRALTATPFHFTGHTS